MIIILLLSLYFFFKRKNLVYALSGYIFMVSEAFRLLPQSFLNRKYGFDSHRGYKMTDFGSDRVTA